MKPVKQQYIAKRLRNQLQNHGISGRLTLMLTFEDLDTSREDFVEDLRQGFATESAETEVEETSPYPQGVEHRIVRESHCVQQVCG